MPLENTTTNGDSKTSQRGSGEGYSEPIGEVTQRPSANLLCQICGLTKCETHRSNAVKHQAVYNKERRKRMQQQGVCQDCGRPAASPRSRCESCLEKRRTWEKTRIQNRKLQGLCHRCSSRPLSVPYAMCEVCLVKESERQMRYRRTKKAQQNKGHEAPPTENEGDTEPRDPLSSSTLLSEKDLLFRTSQTLNQPYRTDVYGQYEYVLPMQQTIEAKILTSLSYTLKVALASIPTRAKKRDNHRRRSRMSQKTARNGREDRWIDVRRLRWESLRFLVFNEVEHPAGRGKGYSLNAKLTIIYSDAKPSLQA
ncbi:hypothetical protein DL770_010047 [Monosporascus sp. CRB-9-2]|nr:hypothetical protein DL770_010047 [Monosporascus sp. CRB-9-2]